MAAASSSSSQNPNEWEVLSMSTMSASSLGLPSLREDEPLQKRSEPLPASETEALQFPTAHTDPPLQPQDLAAPEDIDAPLEEKALLNVEVSDRVPFKNSKVSWWRRPSMLLNLQGTQSKSNAVWSIALLTAFFGIVVVGYRLQRERSHNQQLKLDLYAKEEKLNDLTYQVNRLKEAMTGRRRVGLTRNSFF